MSFESHRILHIVCSLDNFLLNLNKSINNYPFLSMKNLIVIFLVVICAGVLFSEPPDFDTKYKIEYALKDARGTVLSKLLLQRDGDKIKFTKVDNRGKPDEMTTEMFIFKNESKVYTVYTTSVLKMGNRHSLDLSYVGMQTGVYILDLGNDGTLFNSSYINGTETVLGKECTRYIIVSQGDARSEYDMYQNNLMLKRWVGSTAEGNSIEALSFDGTSDIPAGTFTLPTGVEFTDN